MTFHEPRTLELLHPAKPIVFAEIAVPMDTSGRRDLMPAPAADLMNKLNELDQRWKWIASSCNLVMYMRTLRRVGMMRGRFLHHLHFKAHRNGFRRIAGGIVAGLIAEDSVHHVFSRHD